MFVIVLPMWPISRDVQVRKNEKHLERLRFIWGASIEHIILGGFIQDMIFRIDDVSSVLSSQYDGESSCVFFMSRWFKRPLLFIFPGCYERNLREGSLKYRFWGDQRMHMYGKFVDFSCAY